MKRPLLIAILTCLVIVGTTAQTKTTLTEWEFSKDSVSWATVQVPHSANALDGHSKKYYRGLTYYNRSLTVAKDEAKRPTYLLFEGAAQQATVSLNGEKVAHHWGGYTAFTVDLTGRLKEGDNIISVTCNNHGDRNLIPVSSDFNKNNGLHNPVHLLQYNDLYFAPDTKGMHRIKAYSRHLPEGEQLVVKTDVCCKKRNRKVDFVYCLKDRDGKVVMLRDY